MLASGLFRVLYSSRQISDRPALRHHIARLLTSRRLGPVVPVSAFRGALVAAEGSNNGTMVVIDFSGGGGILYVRNNPSQVMAEHPSIDTACSPSSAGAVPS